MQVLPLSQAQGQELPDCIKSARETRISDSKCNFFKKLEWMTGAIKNICAVYLPRWHMEYVEYGCQSKDQKAGGINLT